MSSMVIAWVVFACIFGGALLGMFLRAALPEHHLSADTKDVVKVAIALVATMSALVLSLLISTAIAGACLMSSVLAWARVQRDAQPVAGSDRSGEPRPMSPIWLSNRGRGAPGDRRGNGPGWSRRARPPYPQPAHLWRSNSFASLRPRLVIWMRSVVTTLECDVDEERRPPSGWHTKGLRKESLEEAEAKLARASEILGWLEGEPQVRSEAAE